MIYAIYNPSTNNVRSWVTAASGRLPDGYEFRRVELVPADATPELPEPPNVPESVSLRQFRMALKRAGLFAAVDSLRTNPALTLEQRDDLTEFLEFSNAIERSHPLIAALSPMIGVTHEQIDGLFRLAATL